MLIENKNGLGIINFGTCDTGTYISIREPATLVWNDNRGSVGKYLAQFPVSPENQRLIVDSIMDRLEEDFSNREEELAELLNPLIQLFADGMYRVRFVKDSRENYYRQVWHSGNDSSVEYQKPELCFGEIVQTRQSNEIYRNVTDKRKELSKGDVMLATTAGFYPSFCEFLATQDHKTINQERVSYFKNRIKDGYRPFPIIAEILDEQNDGYAFVIDGHHKLLAYEEMGVYPPLCFIERKVGDNRSVPFDLRKISGMLHSWQLEQLTKYLDQDKNVIREGEEPKPFPAIRKGFFQTFHSNGQLASEGEFDRDMEIGEHHFWHPNGQLKVEGFYLPIKDLVNPYTRMTGTWNWYFPSGNLQTVQQFDVEGRYHGEIIGYYENGIMSSRSMMKNGLKVDGLSNEHWHKNGVKSQDYYYKNDELIEFRHWLDDGRLISHKKMDPFLGKLIDIELENPKPPVAVVPPIVKEPIPPVEERYPDYNSGPDGSMLLKLFALILGLILVFLKTCGPSY